MMAAAATALAEPLLQQALALQAHTREIAALRQARRAAQAQAFRRRGVHEIKPA